MRAELLKLLEICIVRGISDKNDHIKESKPSSPQTYTNPPHTEPRDTSCQKLAPSPPQHLAHPCRNPTLLLAFERQILLVNHRFPERGGTR